MVQFNILASFAFAMFCVQDYFNYKASYKKSRIRETKNLSTDADSRTDTILKKLRDFFVRKAA